MCIGKGKDQIVGFFKKQTLCVLRNLYVDLNTRLLVFHGSAHGLRRSMVIYGNQNGPTRLYLTRRIDWRGFYNRRTPPW